MTFKSVRHLAGFTIKPLLGVMFVLRALLPAAPPGAIVGGQPDGPLLGACGGPQRVS